MPRILYNPESDLLIDWPRVDDGDVVGLQPPVVMLWIEQQLEPDYDPATYGIEATQDVDLDGGVLRRGWALTPLPAPPPPPPVAQWVQFAGMLASDPAVNQLVATAATAAPVLHLMLGVGLGQASDGNPVTFLAAWAQARAGGLVPAPIAAEVAVMAAAFDLPADFVEALS
jgi:hypothetical protein